MNTNTNTSNQSGGPTGDAVQPGTAKTITPVWGKARNQIEDAASRIPANQLTPMWIDCRRANHLFSLSKSVLYRLADEGKIKTVSLKNENMLRGKRLFSTASIQALLEARATGGDSP